MMDEQSPAHDQGEPLSDLFGLIAAWAVGTVRSMIVDGIAWPGLQERLGEDTWADTHALVAAQFDEDALLEIARAQLRNDFVAIEAALRRTFEAVIERARQDVDRED